MGTTKSTDYTQTYIIGQRTAPLINLSKTIAADFISGFEHPWEIFTGLSNYIYALGPTLPYDKYDEVSDSVWVHTSGYMAPSVKINARAIIGSGARICHGAHISGSIIGSYALIGDNSLVKNSIVFDMGKLYASNSVLSSIIGYNANLGAGASSYDTKLDSTNIEICLPEGIYLPGLSKLGSIVGEAARIGTNAVLNPGSVVDEHSIIYPLCSVNGYIPPYSVMKSQEIVVPR